MRTAEEVVNEIHSALGDGDKQGLRNTAALLETLQAWPVCPVIHVAGTNGKGSVCAMLNSVLTAAGYRTGMYTSPFLQTYSERIRLNGKPITQELLARYGNETLDAAEQLKKEKGYHCTPFELGTALAFRTFRAEETELIISETGMGGRLDPTNAVPNPTVCAITAIGMDHMQYLGSTLAEIAGEKAGIIKHGIPVICYPPEEKEVRDVLTARAEQEKAPLTIPDKKWIRIREANARYTAADYETGSRQWNGLKISLPGEHQTVNALVVLCVLDELEKQGIHMPEEAVISGLGNTFWPGRLEWCGSVLMDGAHNAQGIAAFSRYVQEQLSGKRKVLLTGVLKEKLSEEMLGGLASVSDTAVTVTPDSPRAMDAEELAGLLRGQGMEARAANSLKEGLKTARRLAGEDGVILATGSLYFIGALRNELGRDP
ncbi:MAG: bifunctional folylpolyglutamate synthase/dihydrofolate synthase [Clostridia bacterium]|nr:bifunctional folylpolyglutamate synthase/dihydrofolate synthase [Clostridia bacterium]